MKQSRRKHIKDDSSEGFAFVNRRSNIYTSKNVTGYVTSVIDDELKEVRICV